MLPNAAMLIFSLMRHNLSTTLPMNTADNYLQRAYAQVMELKQVSPEILDAFPRPMKGVHRAQARSES